MSTVSTTRRYFFIECLKSAEFFGICVTTEATRIKALEQDFGIKSEITVALRYEDKNRDVALKRTQDWAGTAGVGTIALTLTTEQAKEYLLKRIGTK